MKQAKLDYSRLWPEYEKIWRMVEAGRSGEDEWRADLPDTWNFATIKTAQSAFVDSKVVPTIIRHQDDPKSKAEDLRDLYTDVAEKGNLDQELYYARLDAFKLGNGFTKTIYVKDKRKIWDIKKFNPKTNEFKWEEREINEFDDPKTIRVSPYLILKDDLARSNWNTVRDLIELEVMGRDEAENKYGDLVNFKEIKDTTTLLSQLTSQSKTVVGDTETGMGLRGTEFENLQRYNFFSPGFSWSDEVVEIIHYWNKLEDTYEILINGYPVKVKTNSDPSPIPYIHKQIPYTHYMYSPYGGDEAWAAGIIEIGRHDTASMRKRREKMDDRQSISLFSPAFSDVNDEIDQKNLKLKPFSIIRTKGGVPHQWQIPGITNADLSLQDRDEMSYKRATGIDERILGLQAEGTPVTATEASYLREAALKRLREFAFLYKNSLLQSEIKLKLSLFKQYYSNPLSKESKVKSDSGDRIMKNKFKEFKVRIDNTYVSKEISPNYFEGEVDVDLDLQLLLPMTQSQMTSMYSQLLRDLTPFVQAGVVPNILPKTIEKYIESLGTNMNALKDNKESVSVELAETEHNLFADSTTSSNMPSILPNGTDLKYLSDAHILKHEELLEADVNLEDTEKLRLLDHIQKDISNWKNQQTQQTQPNLSTLNPQSLAGVGGIPRTPQAQQI